MSYEGNAAVQTGDACPTESTAAVFGNDLITIREQARVLNELVIEIRSRLNGPEPIATSSETDKEPRDCFWSRVEGSKRQISQSLEDSIKIAERIRDQF